MTKNHAITDIPKSVNGYKEGAAAEDKIVTTFTLLLYVMIDIKLKLTNISLVPVVKIVTKTCHVWYNM